MLLLAAGLLTYWAVGPWPAAAHPAAPAVLGAGMALAIALLLSEYADERATILRAVGDAAGAIPRP